MTFEAERTDRGHADRFGAIVPACLQECRAARDGEAEASVRVIGQLRVRRLRAADNTPT